ncbi:WGR domain-containing protein [Bacteroides sp. 519]|uniref:WGR domain-containing protein n=1 Tax=Bacteroides sp. 519 TaxID=2302937 RepID=UPI0013D49B6F|nr:WGR domain-containing protein [Bacteroides sp. 519]NDV60541.1 WGR domain-containing protein [Bacteroides sp. 519]
MNTKRTFIYSDDKSEKFWTIDIAETSYTVTFGKTGTNGQTQTKEFADEPTCTKAVNKLIAEKTKKGYVETSGEGDIIPATQPAQPQEAPKPKAKKEKKVEPDATAPSSQTSERQSTTLYFRSGSSDKVYQAELIPATDGSGYLVNAAWGRRGSTLQTGCKTPNPLPLEKAQAIYNKLISEKTAKGYSPGDDGALFVDTDNANRVSGLLPQLLNVIDKELLEQLIADPLYCAQPKHDGERRMIKESQTGVNRKGLTVALPEHLVETFSKHIHGIADLDGEMEGDLYTTFDILSLNGVSLREQPYSERLDTLYKHVTPTDTFALIETAFTAEEKRNLYERLKAENQEGIVFKRLDAPYTHGRPNSGGPQLKYKFCASATVYVIAQNEGKRSVQMGINEEDGACRPVGSVTIPVNYNIPEVGQIIEVRYLYAYPQGSLYQPIYCGVRPDMDKEDCSVSQLKYKKSL